VNKMMPEYKVDVGADKRFREELEKYMSDNIWNKEYDTSCKNYGFCKKSCEAVGRGFGYGQLPHVGENYALKRNGKDFRLAVSAAEVGARYSYQSICDRTGEITKCGCANAKLNPHMRGTLYVLQMMFQVERNLSMRKVKIGEQDANVFSAFALPNFLLCSAPFGDYESGAYTETMRANCARHFHETLRILKPNVLITLGSRPHEYFRAYHGIDVDCQNPKFHEITVGDLDNPVAQGHDILMLSLYHPAYYREWSNANIDGKIKCGIDELLAKYDESA